MKRLSWAVAVLLCVAASASAEDLRPDAGAETVNNRVQVVVEKRGGSYSVKPPASSGGSAPPPCDYVVVPRDGEPPAVVAYCDGGSIDFYELDERDVVDLDAAAAAEADRYIDEVLAPEVRIGTNPSAAGLVGLSSWFWIEGWTGAAQAPPISAYGVTIDVRLTSGAVAWDFGDGTVATGDLGQPYPARSSVRHAYQRPGTHTVTAAIELAAEYRVDGGPWLALDPLTASATTQHPVEERQAVIVER